jgi:hypothetical protein
LAKSKFNRTTPELRNNILQFYSDLSASALANDTKISSVDVLALLDQLKAATLVPGGAADAEW